MGKLTGKVFFFSLFFRGWAIIFPKEKHTAKFIQKKLKYTAKINHNSVFPEKYFK